MLTEACETAKVSKVRVWRCYTIWSWSRSSRSVKWIHF